MQDASRDQRHFRVEIRESIEPSRLKLRVLIQTAMSSGTERSSPPYLPLIDAESSLTQAAANLSMNTLWSYPFDLCPVVTGGSLLGNSLDGVMRLASNDKQLGSPNMGVGVSYYYKEH